MMRCVSLLSLCLIAMFALDCGDPIKKVPTPGQEQVQTDGDGASKDLVAQTDGIPGTGESTQDQSTSPEPSKETTVADNTADSQKEAIEDAPPPDSTPDEPMDSGGPEPTPEHRSEPTPERRTLPDTPTKTLTRSMQWVRKNPMFISGLIPSMGAPTPAVAKEYFQGFHANAVHLWEDGMGTEMDGWRNAGLGNVPFLSWVHLDGTSTSNKKIIGGYKANVPGRIGYQIGDEPHDMATLLKIEAGAKKVRLADPNALIIVNFSYQAGNALDGMLHYFLKDMKGDIVSYDQYTRSQGTFEHLARYRKFGLQYAVPYWRYLRTYLPSRDGKDEIHESDMRWDAFSGLTYGYTGHSHFIYQISPIHKLIPALFAAAGSYTSAKTPLYAIAAQINKELAHMGKAITQLTSTDVRYVASLLQPKSTQAWSKGAGKNPYIEKIAPASGEFFLDILVGFFDDDAGEQYVMVQNMRHKHGSTPLNTTRAGKIQVTFDFNTATATGFNKTRVMSLNPKTGKVEMKALRSLGGGKAMLEVTLAAGDALLFKYDTGAAFALQK